MARAGFDSARHFVPKRPAGDKFYPADWIDGNANLTDAEKRVTVRLMRFYDVAKGFAWPSHKKLAEAVGKSDRQIRRILVCLEAKGVIEWNWRGRQEKTGWRLANAYQFLRHPMYPEGSPAWAPEAMAPTHKSKTETGKSQADFKRTFRAAEPDFKRTSGAFLNGHQMSEEQEDKPSSSRKQEHKTASTEKAVVQQQHGTDAKPKATSFEPMMMRTHEPEPKPQPATVPPDGASEAGTPIEQFASRLEARHGHDPLIDRERIMADVQRDLGGIPLSRYLEADATATTNAKNLKNPHGHYRKLAKDLANREAARTYETLARVRLAQQATANQPPSASKCGQCKYGMLPTGGYCGCKTGRDLERAEGRKGTPMPDARILAKVTVKSYAPSHALLARSA